MFEKPVKWNGGELPAQWGDSTRMRPEIWHIDTASPNTWNVTLRSSINWNKTLSAEWKNASKLPENWGDLKTVIKTNTEFSQLAGVVQNASAVVGKIGNVTKNAISGGVDFIKSEETAQKIGFFKDKLKSVASTVAETTSEVAHNAIETAKSEKNTIKKEVIKSVVTPTLEEDKSRSSTEEKSFLISSSDESKVNVNEDVVIQSFSNIADNDDIQILDIEDDEIEHDDYHTTPTSPIRQNQYTTSNINQPQTISERISANKEYHNIPQTYSQPRVSQRPTYQPPRQKYTQIDRRHDEIYAAMVASVNKSKNRKKTLHVVEIVLLLALLILISILLGAYIMKINQDEKFEDYKKEQYQLDGIEYNNSLIEMPAVSIEKTEVANEPVIEKAYIEARDPSIDYDGDGIKDFVEGADSYLHVEGNYSYCYYEYYERDDPELNDNGYLYETGKIVGTHQYLGSGSRGFWGYILVTPYNEDGIAGETVTVDPILDPNTYYDSLNWEDICVNEFIRENTNTESQNSIVFPDSSKETLQNKINLIDDVYERYYDIVSDKYNMVNGSLIDLNDNGIEELIIPYSSNDSFAIYSYENGSMNEDYFGKYMATTNIALYKVIGSDGSAYIYYRDNYAYQSCQGYYNPQTEESIDVYINYISEDGVNYIAEWEISYHSPDYGSSLLASYSEPVETFYAQPSNCHSELLYQLNLYGFDIDDGSEYISITYLYDELPGVISEILSINEENTIGHGYIATDENSTLNLRSAPFTNSDIVTRIPYNEIVAIYEDVDDWFYVRYEDNYGYVSKRYINAYIYN